MPLAEPLTGTLERRPIDILVGLEYDYDFIRGGRITFADGLMLLESSVGFDCTGKVDDELPSEEHSLLITEGVALFTPDAHLHKILEP